VVRVRCDDPADNNDGDDDGLIKKFRDEVREEFKGVKELRKQMDERMRALEDNVAKHQENVEQKLSDIRRMLGELLAARVS
jgi:predicted  nucleic acid-binding Zn-ribbon protein